MTYSGHGNLERVAMAIIVSNRRLALQWQPAKKWYMVSSVAGSYAAPTISLFFLLVIMAELVKNSTISSIYNFQALSATQIIRGSIFTSVEGGFETIPRAISSMEVMAPLFLGTGCVNGNDPAPEVSEIWISDGTWYIYEAHRGWAPRRLLWCQNYHYIYLNNVYGRIMKLMIDNLE